MFDFRRFFHPYYIPIYLPAVLSLIGTLFFLFGDRTTLIWMLHDRWSLTYFLCAPFIHSGVFHLILNVFFLHYVGGQMLLPIIGARRFILLFVTAAVVGNIVNNLVSIVPAIGISAATMSILACTLYRYGEMPMKFLLLHDLLRLPPFQLRYLAAFAVLVDIAGIIFNWHFIAHGAHLGGFATGLVFGAYFFRRPPPFPFWFKKRRRTKITLH